VDSSFASGGSVRGSNLVAFEVNGWHNLVHILSGLVLLASAPRRAIARTVVLAFGIVYGIVAIWGLIDGNDVLGLIPVNAADNVLHIALSAVGILAAMASDTGDLRTAAGEERFTRDVDPLTGAPREDPTRARGGTPR
jgi:hypothetical protein